jgi:FtsZ-binding cell division protein ZapB
MIRTLIEIQGDRVSITVDGEESTPAVRKICNWCPEGTWDDRFHPNGAGHLQVVSDVISDRNQRIVELNDELDVFRRRVGELETALTQSQNRVTVLEAEADELQTVRSELRQARAEAQRYKDSAYRENERAAENKAWAKRAEANGVRLSEALVEAEKSVTKLRRAMAARAVDRDRLAELEDQATTAGQNLAARSRLLAEATGDRDRLAAQIGKVSGAVHGPVLVAALQTDWKNWTEHQAVALTRAVQEARRAIGSPGVGTEQA